MPDEAVKLSRKDFQSDQEVRWCPGCGDYSILTAVQLLLPELDVKPENLVFVSGIGCAARFPYYMNVYGLHGIHGRAPAIATGIALTRPDLDVWVITGDGDALSIGGNHLIHSLRRNVNFTMLLFNNQIYGLTTGQYSPTSDVVKGTPPTSARTASSCTTSNATTRRSRSRSHVWPTPRRCRRRSGSSVTSSVRSTRARCSGSWSVPKSSAAPATSRR